MTPEAASAAALAQFVPEWIPGAVAVVLVRGRPCVHHAVGLARQPDTPARRSTPFDLASLTKALVTAPVCAALQARGALDVTAPTREPGAPEGLTLLHLLDHVSGLPAWRPLHEAVAPDTADRRRVLAEARAVPFEAPPGQRHTYSDIGFLRLLEAVERAGGARLDALFEQHVLDRLPSLALTWGHPDAAATERQAERGLLRGLVNDRNCAAMGGVSSHAGLFGTALSVARLARDLLRRDGPLPEIAATLHAWFVRPGVGSHRGGWDRPTPGGSTGDALPSGAVGHLGYTGTSVWAVPDRDTVLVLLTNRIHPTDDLRAIKALRPAWHRAVATPLGW